jgi:hypothetical protein
MGVGDDPMSCQQFFCLGEIAAEPYRGVLVRTKIEMCILFGRPHTAGNGVEGGPHRRGDQQKQDAGETTHDVDVAKSLSR